MARSWPNSASNRLKVGGNPSALNFPGNASKFTLAAWVKLNSNGAADQTFLSKYNGSFGPILRTLSGKVRMFWIDSGAGGHEAIGATTMSTGVWHHIAATWPKSTSPGMQVWLDGAVDGADTGSATMNTTAETTDGWTFGARAQATQPLDGAMAEVCMFNDVLTADQIAALAKGRSPFEVAPGLLVGYWPIFGDYDNQIDFSEQGNKLTLVGTLASADHAPVAPQIPLVEPESLALVVTATPPVNTVAPVAEAWPEVGRLVHTTDGTWTGTPTPTFTYQWQVSNDGSTGWTNATGSSTSSSYRVPSGYLGKFLRCVVTGTNTSGSASANSNVVGAVTDSPTGGYAAVAVS